MFVVLKIRKGFRLVPKQEKQKRKYLFLDKSGYAYEAQQQELTAKPAIPSFFCRVVESCMLKWRRFANCVAIDSVPQSTVIADTEFQEG